ncbi:hypothetical protein [Tessaracoccus palaemonis]|uniref:Carboxypeptidase regulatory-like domain-containing protein n=1 Tax=Tessaracoccus palaemonis TaxID=2829499 RepID=A0ABX8SJF0_9ACTN|nr:hypothetical protein [Tessaracoccus palaemonis]QXT62565.1 hypothetical protein KDB89_12600 [Tessaracoccus palaemonis]
MHATRWASVTCLASLFLLPMVPATATGDGMPAAPVTIGLPADDVTVSPTPTASDATPTVEASEEPTPEAVPPTLTASGPGKAGNGEVVTISGTLTQDGAAVPNCGINVSDANGDVADSFTVTDADGRYITMYAVPEDQGDGSLTLTLISETPTEATTSVSLTVKHTDISTASPSADEVESEEADVAPPEETDAGQSVAATATPAAEPTSSSSSPGLGVWTWFIGALVGLGGIAAASTAFLIYRDRRARADEDLETGGFLDDDEESLGLLDSDSAPSAQSPGEAATAPGVRSAVDQEPPRPSRGLPADGDAPQPPTAGRRGI